MSIIVSVVACKTTSKTADKKNDIKLTVLEDGGYFLKNNIVLRSDVSCLVATSQSVLDQNFGYGAVMGETHTPPDLSKVMVLATVAKSSNIKKKLSYISAVLVDSNLVVNISVTEGEGLGYEATPIALASVAHNEQIKTVSFYNEGKLIRKVDL